MHTNVLLCICNTHVLHLRKIKMKWTTVVLVFDESEYGLFPYFCSTTKVLHCMTLHKSQAEIKALSNLNTM